MSYVDGIVLAVPAANREAYKALCSRTGEMFKEFGASEIVECWGDDVPDGKLTDFRRAVKAEEGEVVVFAWILWPSRQARDEGHRKMMADERMQSQDMPFDGKRMIFGGFDVLYRG